MSHTLTVELPEDTFAPLRERAQAQQREPEEWARDTLVQALATGGQKEDTPGAGEPRGVRSEAILSGEPILAGTRTPVRAIVELWRMGMAPEEIPRHLPHLTLGQVFAALCYYSDHQAEIHRHIERNRVLEERIDPLVRDL
jgi:uncharacterized protein (DUF433 family)